jgi:hypothetical protein
MGLGVDNLIEVSLVTASGDLITANNATNPDLFYALRGGGGSTGGDCRTATCIARWFSAAERRPMSSLSG